MSCGGCRASRSIRCSRAGAASPRCCRTSPIAAAPPACSGMLDKLLERGGWDGIVFDGISVGWALAPVRDHLCRPQRPAAPDLRLAQSRGEPARTRSPRASALSLKRQAVRLDASKSRGWSASWSTQVDFVTAITPEDLKLYRAPPRRQADGRADAGLLRPTARRARDHRRRCRAAP